jgi:hypothetical protein
MTLPEARTDQLIVEDLAEETVIYDLDRDQAHCLNRTAALVWRHCDGRATVGDLAALLGRELNFPSDERVVWLALDRLQKANLLQGSLEIPMDPDRYSRRELARRLGLAGGLAVLLPLLTTLTAPTPLHAQTAPAVLGATGRGLGIPARPTRSQLGELTRGQTPGRALNRPALTRNRRPGLGLRRLGGPGE